MNAAELLTLWSSMRGITPPVVERIKLVPDIKGILRMAHDGPFSVRDRAMTVTPFSYKSCFTALARALCFV